jgi:glycosyltransferase involved in cell wall biosynthesis
MQAILVDTQLRSHLRQAGLNRANQFSWEKTGQATATVLEAMACGTPVITANISALPEVAGDATLLINPENVAEITAAMQAILTDGLLRSRLRQAGIARASQFSWEKTGKLTADFLQKYL